MGRHGHCGFAGDWFIRGRRDCVGCPGVFWPPTPQILRPARRDGVSARQGRTCDLEQRLRTSNLRPAKSRSSDYSKPELVELADARKTVRDLASQFRAFAYNETYALRFARVLGYDPLKASEGLFGLSNSLETYGGERVAHRKIVQTALKTGPEPLTKEEFGVLKRIGYFPANAPAVDPNSTAIGIAGVR
jgi:hypothetical protein